MRAACLIALLLATATAQARTLGGDLLFSTDTDDNDIRRTTVNGWEAVSVTERDGGPAYVLERRAE